MTDQEALVREAIAAEADQAVDHRAVLAHLRRRTSRRRPLALIAAATLTAAAAAVAVIIPLSVDRSAAPGAADPAVTPPSPRTVLLMGLDEGPSPRTDSVALVRVAEGVVSVVSLPRDLWVEIPGVGTGKLNSVYGRAHEAARAAGQDGDTAGARALVGVVEGLTGVGVDHYAAVGMARVAELADAVGGVEVCLRGPVRDEFSGVDLPAGRQTLRGAQAQAFLRQRFGLPRGDLDRVTRHQVFLRGLVGKTGAAAGDPAKLAALVERARGAVRTDPGWDLSTSARLLSPTATVRTATVPLGGEVTSAEGVGLSTDPAAVRAFLADFLADRPDVAPAPDSPVEPAPGDGCVN